MYYGLADSADACTPNQEYSNSVPVSSHQWFCYKISDKATNETVGSVEIKVDKSKPTTEIVSPAESSWHNSDFEVSISDSDIGGSELSTCWYRVKSFNGTDWVITKSGVQRSCNSPVTLTVSSEGYCKNQGQDTCEIDVWSFDKAGSKSEENVRKFSIDWTLPEVSITSPSEHQVVVGTLQIQPSVSDNLDSQLVCSYKFDDEQSDHPLNCNGGEIGISTLAEGHHTLYVYAYDDAGNRGEASVDFIVNNDGILTVDDTPENNPDFTSIQAAIDAASDGDTIEVAAGIYDEQVVIDKSLTLQGTGDSTIIKPSQSTADNFQIFNRKVGGSANSASIIVTDGVGNTITIKNLKIDGSLVSSIPSEANGFQGILYRGTNGTIDSVTIDDIGIAYGNGIYLSSLGQTVTIEVKDCIISDYLKNGITANYDGLTVNIHDNTIIGMSPTDSIAQNGIQIGFGATGKIINNNISDNVWTGTYGGSNDPISDTNADGAAGILLYMPGSSQIEIATNTLSNNQFGIWTVAAPSVNIHDNNITGLAHTGNAFPTGIAIWSADMWTDDFGGSEQETTGVVNNNSLSSNDYGIIVRDYIDGGVAPAPTINSNKISGNITYGVWSNVSTGLDATNNYWGTAYKPTIQEMISGEVDFEPYYVDEGMTILNDELPDTVYVDDDYSDGNAGEHIFGYDAFSTIQEGIDAVVEGGSVNVAAGTYNEALIVDKSLTLKGANADINPVTETRGDESTIIGDGSSAAVTIQGESVALDGFTITNGGFDGGLELSGYSHLIKNNIITNNNGIGIYLNAGSGHNIFRHNLISNNKESGWNTGGAMLQTGCYDNLFEENKFINNQHSGVLLYFNNPTYAWMMKEGEDPNSWSGNTFIGNTFQAEPSDDTLYYYGLALLESEGTTISNNSFTNWHNAAITIQHASKDNIVEENNIINNERGIKIFDEPVNTQIHYNNISGNSLYAIENKGTALINATNNWWGDISGPYNEVTNVGGTGNAVSDNVDYRPWCAEESCSSIDSTAPYIVGGTPTPSSVGIDPATNIEINFR